MPAPTTGGLRPIAAPHALFTALEAFRPRDTYAALAALFARWVTASHRAAPSRVEASVEVGAEVPADVELRLHFDTSAPAQTVATSPARARRLEQTTSSRRLSLVAAM